MAIKLKKSIIFMLTAMIFIFAGLFLVGCDEDYSKVLVEANKHSVELEVGETETIEFEIKNASKKFFKKFSFNVDNKDVIDYSDVKYNDNIATVTIVALRGGAVNLTAVTEDGYSYASVSIYVLQYSETLDFNNSYLYMSESTPFVVNNGYFIYDDYTTDKNMTYYYIDNHNLNTVSKDEVDMDYATFVSANFENGAKFTFRNKYFASAEYLFDGIKFDTAKTIENEGNLSINLYLNNAVVKTIAMCENFSTLSLYNYSLNYETPLVYVNKVNVLRDLDVKVYGGYVSGGSIDFELLNGRVSNYVTNYDVKVVPNDTEYANSFVIRIEASNLSSEIEKNYSNKFDFLNVDNFDISTIGSFTIDGQSYASPNMIDSGKTVFYMLVSSATFSSAEANFDAFIRYKSTINQLDTSVNFNCKFNVRILFQPKQVLLNGIEESVYSSAANRVTLYNYYVNDEGWQEFNLSISTLVGESTPEFSYINIEFKSNEIQMQYGQGITPDYKIRKNDFNPTQVFRYKGQSVPATDDFFTIHVVWEDSPKGKVQIDYVVYYQIVDGVTDARRNDGTLGQSGVIFVDYYDSQTEYVHLDNYIYANAFLQSFSFSLSRGTDVVYFHDNDGDDDFYESYSPGVIGGVTYYYLNFSVSAKAEGTGTYAVKLDNGYSVSITITVVLTLKKTNTNLVVQDSGDAKYYNFEMKDGYNSILNLEILNPTTLDETGNYKVLYGNKPVALMFNGHITSVTLGSDPARVRALKRTDTLFEITTIENGIDEILFTVYGYEVTRGLQRQTTYITFLVNIVSYSLLTEFALTDSNGEYAVENYVYCGTSSYITDDNKKIVFSTKYATEDAFNFYEYYLAEELFTKVLYIDNDPDLKDKYSLIDGFIKRTKQELNEYSIYANRFDTSPWNFYIENDYIKSDLTRDYFAVEDNYKYIYYYVTDDSGRARPTETTVRVSIELDGEVNWIDMKFKFENGVMFYVDNDSEFTTFDHIYNSRRYKVKIEYSNEFTIAGIASYDLEKQTYTQISPNLFSFIIHSYVRQRNYSQMRYETIISGVNYQDVEDISLTTYLDEIAFTKTYFEETVYVSLTPTDATNLSLYAEFVPDDYETSAGLIDYTYNYIGNGVYEVIISAEKFSKDSSRSNVERKISGVLYIYPEEWGNLTGLKETPIQIAITYRNGSESNRYILSTPDDVIAINDSIDALESHYELASTIDLSGVSFESPIGIIDGELIGFSGSIVGTTSNAIIKGIDIKFNPTQPDATKFFAYVEEEVDQYYAGLFAEISRNAYIKNVTMIGSMDVELNASIDKTLNMGIIAGVNYGTLRNVGVYYENNSQVSNTKVSIRSLQTSNIGAMVGVNKFGGLIEQDYAGYMYVDGVEIKNYKKQTTNGEFYGMTPKIMSYFTNKLSISVDSGATVYVGGIAGLSNGIIRKVNGDKVSLYGYGSYSAYVDIEVSTIIDSVNPTVYAGAVVGAIVSIPLTNAENVAGADLIMVSGLTIGGEVDNKILNGNNYVGGIAGMSKVSPADEILGKINIVKIEISYNIIRTFLRGSNYVGALIGTDANTGTSDPRPTQFISNTIEAVDDGRIGLDASMIIVTQTKSGTRLISSLLGGKTKVAIGDKAFQGSNNYNGYNEDVFGVYSYVDRGAPVDLTSSIASNDSSVYYGDYVFVDNVNGGDNSIAFAFEKKTINLGVESSDSLVLKNSKGESIYYTFYFEAKEFSTSNASQITAQEYVEKEGLNTYLIGSEFYPFKLQQNEAQIVSYTSNLISVDIANNITALSTGIALVSWQSILNSQKTLDVYLFITNYVNLNYTESILYSGNSLNTTEIKSGAKVNVYGKNQQSIYVVPTYENSDLSIDIYGNIRIKNTTLKLQENKDMTAEVVWVDTTSNKYIEKYVNGQLITFFSANLNEDGQNEFTIRTYLSTIVDSEEYTNLENVRTGIYLYALYHETATDIYTSSSSIAMESNEAFDETITVESLNNDFIYYEIYYVDGGNTLVQSKMVQKDTLADWQAEINDTDDELFALKFDLDSIEDLGIKKIIKYNFNISINRKSEQYKLITQNNLYGTYKIVFFGNELEKGVSTKYFVYLSEAQLTDITVENYPNIADMAISNNTIITSQFGLFEINLDPSEAEFEYLEIRNDEMNYREGAGEVYLTFAYQTKVNGVVSNMNVALGTFVNGIYRLKYKDLVDFYATLKNDDLYYNGKIFVRYFLSSTGVEDGKLLKMNFKVVRKDGEMLETSIDLITKLSNFVALKFAERELAETYYFARGLSYNAVMTYYGFALNDIEVKIKGSENSGVATLTQIGDQFILAITKNELTYPQDDVGVKLVISIAASKLVDNIEVKFEDEITVYVMEYVFNYKYVEGINEDIVDKAENGVIAIAIGNNYQFGLDIWDYMEYDKQNPTAAASVKTFVDMITENVRYSLYDKSEGCEGVELGDEVEYRSNYYYINGLNFVGVKLYDPEQKIYNFTVDGYYYMYNGLYYGKAASSQMFESYKLFTNFTFRIHKQSTDENPTPIESYEDLIRMEEGEYYILLANILIPDSRDMTNGQFTPISTKIASFDGNGYTITFGGTYIFDQLNVGLFSSVSSSTVLKNISIVLGSTTNFVMECATFNIGMIAGSNAGVITNCAVYSPYNYTLSVTAASATNDSYVAGFVGQNEGIITNSRCMININANLNLAGFVGTNSGEGIISSSYFKGASLKNGSTSASTAGFVLTNSGAIYTSYISGEIPDQSYVYYSGNDDFVESNANIAGFVYTNTGKVENCYSNISLRIKSSAFSAGFVFNNGDGGVISRCFSTSVLRSNNVASYGFARYSNGTIEDAFYLSDEKISVNCKIGPDINDDKNSITALTYAEFGIEYVDSKAQTNTEKINRFKKIFKNYNFSSSLNRDINAVWFYNDTNLSSAFNNGVFNLHRLELVAPNIIAFAQRQLHSVEEVVDQETGVRYSRYVYVNSRAADDVGSLYNPILIDSPVAMENYIANEVKNGYNKSYYRLINNIDYSKYPAYSELYTTRFIGYLEGNNMTIDGIYLVSSKKLNYAGLFAEVGSSSRADAIGTLLNFTFNPGSVIFSNSVTVGGIAGKLENGTIANVKLITKQDELVVTGVNIVGGLVGIAVGNYVISDIYSQFSAKATYVAKENDAGYSSTSYVYNIFSYAGNTVGVLGGKGSLDRITVDSYIIVRGSTAGFVVGFVDTNATMKNISITIDEKSVLNAHIAGGLVVGESIGTITNIQVIGNDQNDSVFSFKPYIAKYVGGIIGVMSGGILDTAETSQNLKLSTATSTSGCMSVGGVVGYATAAVSLKNIKMSGDITGFYSVGGLIGSASGDGIGIRFENIRVEDVRLSVLSRSRAFAYIGGLVGESQGMINYYITSSVKFKNEDLDIIKEETNIKDILYKDRGLTDAGHINQIKALNSKTITSVKEDLYPVEKYVEQASYIGITAHVLAYFYNIDFQIYTGEFVAYMTSGVISAKNTISVLNIEANAHDVGEGSGSAAHNDMLEIAPLSESEKPKNSENEPLDYDIYGIAENISNIVRFTNSEYEIGKGNLGYVTDVDALYVQPIYNLNIVFSNFTGNKVKLNIYNNGVGVSKEFIEGTTV